MHITVRSVSSFRNGASSRRGPQGLAGGSLPSCNRFPALEEEFQPLTALKSPCGPSHCSTVLRCVCKIPAPLHPRTSGCDTTVPASSPGPLAEQQPPGPPGPRPAPGGGLGDSAGNSSQSGTSVPTAKPCPLLLERVSQRSAGREGKGQTAQTQTPALPAPASFMDLRADLQRAIS